MPIPGIRERTEMLVTCLFAPHRDVRVGAFVGGEHFHCATSGDLADAAFGFQERAGACRAASVDDLIGF